MISFNTPIKLRGKHAAYAQYLSKDKGQLRKGGVNVFQRIMDCYLVSIIVGLQYKTTAKVDNESFKMTDIFGNKSLYGDKVITTSDVALETVLGCQIQLDYIYRVVMLTENLRNLSVEEKISNAFKSDTNEQKLQNNKEFLNELARGGLEILYDRFRGLADNENEIMKKKLTLFTDLGKDVTVNDNYF